MKAKAGRFIWVVLSLVVLAFACMTVVACEEEEESAEPTATLEAATPTSEEGSEGSGVAALTVTKESASESFTLDDVQAMPAEEGWGGLMNSVGEISGPFEYKGVPLLDLVESVGELGEEDAVRIEAKDGYAMTFSYEQLTGGDFTTLDSKTGEEVPHDELTVIVAYEEDGEPLGEQTGPLRIAILSDEDQVTEGHWWIKWVTKIDIVPLNQPWTLTLEGAITEEIDSGTFESGAAPDCHGIQWTDDQGREWEGIPLWLLVGRVDDEISHEDGAFNDEVADAGYEVHLIAADEYTVKLDSSEVKRNDDLIVAYKMNDMPIPEKNWPLRLVGPGLDKQSQVGQIQTIKLVFAE